MCKQVATGRYQFADSTSPRWWEKSSTHPTWSTTGQGWRGSHLGVDLLAPLGTNPLHGVCVGGLGKTSFLYPSSPASMVSLCDLTVVSHPPPPSKTNREAQGSSVSEEALRKAFKFKPGCQKKPLKSVETSYMLPWLAPAWAAPHCRWARWAPLPPPAAPPCGWSGGTSMPRW